MSETLTSEQQPPRCTELGFFLLFPGPQTSVLAPLDKFCQIDLYAPSTLNYTMLSTTIRSGVNLLTKDFVTFSFFWCITIQRDLLVSFLLVLVLETFLF